jgi:hypothetical protein
VSIENVINRVESEVEVGKKEIYIGNINLERDAKLMLQNNLLDEFLGNEKLKDYTYIYNPKDQVIEVTTN